MGKRSFKETKTHIFFFSVGMVLASVGSKPRTISITASAATTIYRIFCETIINPDAKCLKCT